MRFKDSFEKWGLSGLKVKAPFLEVEWVPSDSDKNAAWDLYVELLTRTATQVLPASNGIEKTALDSIYSLFDITRQILKHHGRSCIEFTTLSIIILNQVIRPFTSKWHMLSEKKAFEDPSKCLEFRSELTKLQIQIRNYTKLLADLADVEDLTEIDTE